MKKTAVFMVLLMLICLFAGCTTADVVRETVSSDAVDNSGAAVGSSVVQTEGTVATETATEAEPLRQTTDDGMFTARDMRTDYNETDSVKIQLNGTTAQADSDSVKISDNVITLTQEATYIVSGTLTDGMIIVNAPDTAKLQIVLDGADITSQSSAALYILEADKVFVTLAQGTTNTLANGGAFTAIDENNIDAAVFSKQDLTLNGTGRLTVTSPVGHGIVCKDDLVLTGGTYAVQSASHGMDANDSVRIAGLTELAVSAGKDGIHCENTEDTSRGFVYIADGQLNVDAQGDGISAGAYVQIENGMLDLLCGGGSENGSKASSDGYGYYMGGAHGGMRPGESPYTANETEENSTSMKGIKAVGNILINGGCFSIDSADDALHSDASLAVNGGTFEIESGDDAVHAEDTLTVSGGIFRITESYEGLEALHVVVTDGDIRLKATDDGINAAGGTDASGTAGGRDGMFGGGPGGGRGGMFGSSDGSIVISGGTLYIHSSGDGLDANGTLEIAGGHTTVVGPTQGDTATLDYDVSGTVTGGTFIGTGALGMAQSFSDSAQGVLALRVGEQSAGTDVMLKDTDGNVILSFEPELSFAVVIISSPEMVKGETYILTVGSESGEFTAN